MTGQKNNFLCKNNFANKNIFKGKKISRQPLKNFSQNVKVQMTRNLQRFSGKRGN